MKGYRPPQPEQPMLPGAAVATEDGEFVFQTIQTVHKIPNAETQAFIDETRARGDMRPIMVPDDKMDIVIKASLLMLRPSAIARSVDAFPVDGPVLCRFSLAKLRAAFASRKANQNGA